VFGRKAKKNDFGVGGGMMAGRLAFDCEEAEWKSE
jgi:hypothetical protein